MRSLSGVLLFDGYCILCSGFVRYLVRKFDNSLQVIAMQSSEGLYWLNKYQLEAEPDEVILLFGKGVKKGVAVILFLMQHAGGIWKILGRVASLFPNAFLFWLYRRIANNRYLVFGKRTTCYSPYR